MRYWKKRQKMTAGFYDIMCWYIEYDDGTYLNIVHEGNPTQTRAFISKHRGNPIQDPNIEYLIEIPKEEVIKALKKALKILDLPKEISFLNYKF